MARYTGYRSGRIVISDYFPPGVKWLLIVNTIIFVLTYLCPFPVQRQIMLVLALSAEAAVRNLFVWQLVTYMFLHAGFLHILFNMLTLWMFGIQLERDWGTRRFLKYYFYCGIAAGVCVLVVNILLVTGAWLRWAPAGDLRRSGGLWRDVPGPDRADVFPVSDQGEVPRDDFRRGRVAAHLRAEYGREHHRPPGRCGFRFCVSEGAAAAAADAGCWGAYRQWKLRRAKKKFQTFMKKRDGRGPWVN